MMYCWRSTICPRFGSFFLVSVHRQERKFEPQEKARQSHDYNDAKNPEITYRTQLRLKYLSQLRNIYYKQQSSTYTQTKSQPYLERGGTRRLRGAANSVYDRGTSSVQWLTVVYTIYMLVSSSFSEKIPGRFGLELP